MKNFNDWLHESLQEDAQIRAELAKHINEKIANLKTKNAKAISDASKIIEVDVIIEQAKEWLIRSIPSVIAGLKSGKGGDVFASGFVNFVNAALKKELDEVNWVKRGTAKVFAPDKASFLARAKNFDASPFIWALKSCLDLGFAVGWMESTKPYQDQLWQWSNSLTTWLDKNEPTVKAQLAGTFSNFLWA